MSTFAEPISLVRDCEPMRFTGTVDSLRGLTVLVRDLPVRLGSLVSIRTGGSRRLGEVVGFDRHHTIIMLLEQATGVRAGDHVVCEQSSPTIRIGPQMLGRIVNAVGRPIDGGGSSPEGAARPIHPPPLGAMERGRIDRPLSTGVRAIDLATTVGRGQRMGLFAGPGVGKSTLLGMIARHTDADVNVIALIGERGREVREFVEKALGPEGLARSIVFVATSDESPVMRVRAALAASAAAEYFRDRGHDVLLMVDSLTRFAHAQRQIGLAVGEPPATKGYTPSVFALLPQLLERAGAVESNASRHAGSITGFYTILVEGDDLTEPISDAVRGILDGHVVLTRSLAQRAHFPAIDVLDSISRVADDICPEEHLQARRSLLRLLAAHREVEELVQIGAYAAGSNRTADVALHMKGQIDELLQQKVSESESLETAREKLIGLMKAAEILLRQQSRGGTAPR